MKERLLWIINGRGYTLVVMCNPRTIVHGVPPLRVRQTINKTKSKVKSRFGNRLADDGDDFINNIFFTRIKPVNIRIGYFEPITLSADENARGASHLDFGLLNS